ncbi:MAG TPA: hypothetical protein VFE29_03390, partial [Terriglobia bacterium]|nr:hypothetical protein [Terriglobia bacterium]
APRLKEPGGRSRDERDPLIATRSTGPGLFELHTQRDHQPCNGADPSGEYRLQFVYRRLWEPASPSQKEVTYRGAGPPMNQRFLKYS